MSDSCPPHHLFSSDLSAPVFRLLVSDGLVRFAGGFSCLRNDGGIFVFSRCVFCSFFVPVLLLSFHFGFFCDPTQSEFGSFMGVLW